MTRKSVPLNTIRLSIVVTVYSETFSIDETIKILLGKDRGYIQEIILVDIPPSVGRDLLYLPAVGGARSSGSK